MPCPDSCRRLLPSAIQFCCQSFGTSLSFLASVSAHAQAPKNPIRIPIPIEIITVSICFTSLLEIWPLFALSIPVAICHRYVHPPPGTLSFRTGHCRCPYSSCRFYLPFFALLGHHLGLVLIVISLACLSVLQINVSAGQLTCALTSG